MRAVKGSLSHSFKERHRELKSVCWTRAAQKEQARHAPRNTPDTSFSPAALIDLFLLRLNYLWFN
jgi:hypothetical protein